MKFNYLLLVLIPFAWSCEMQIKSKVVTDAEYTEGIEGPAVGKTGSLYVVNFKKQGTIGVLHPGSKKTELLLELPKESVGNGIRFLNDSVFLVADYVQHQLLKVKIPNLEITTYASDSSMNQPNDIAVSKAGVVYASDPNWSKSTGQLWMIDQQRKAYLIEQNMGTTNGVEVSANEKYLYVNESVQRKVWRYELNSSGTPVNKQLFFEFEDFGMDGMRCDSQGNLYIARYDKGTVAVLSKNGKLRYEVELKGKKPTNVAFGGNDGTLVYVTLQDKKWIECFNAEFPGRAFELLKH